MTKQKFNIWYWIAALLGLLVVQYVVGTVVQPVATIPYSQFQQLLNEGKIAEVGVSDRFLQGTLKEPLPGGQTRFSTTRVEPPEFAEELSRHGVRYTGQVESNLLPTLLSWILPVLLFFGVWYFLAQRIGAAQGGLMQIGKSKAKIYVEADTGVSFTDVAGVDEAKDELRAPPTLTRRETECLRWVAVGRSDPQIGMILGLSANTVHAHVEAAKTKLDANSRAQLVLRAVMAGILRSDPSR